MGMKVTETTKRGGGSSSRGIDGRNARRTFIVQYDADTPPASFAVVEVADDGETAIPSLWDALAGDAFRVVTNISVKPRDDTGLLFDVTVDYNIPEADQSDDPLSDPVDYDWDFSASSQPYFRDESDPAKLVQSSAGEPFENLLEREVGEITVTVTANIFHSAWNPATAAEFMYPAVAVSDADMTIDGIAVGAGTVKMGGIRCSGIKTRNAVDYRTLTVVLKLRSTWDHKVDDRGFHALDDGKLVEIVKGVPPVKPDRPWPLDGSGGAKANADDEPAELTFVPNPRRDSQCGGSAKWPSSFSD